MAERQRFAGRTAIVTGAGAGIGKATALMFLAEGARVVAADISAERLADLGDGGGKLVTVAGDISDEAVVEQVIAAAEGRVDVLANIAGIMDGFLAATELDDETWERVMAVNVTAVMRLTRAALKLMVSAKSGAIVNISSAAGLRGSAAGFAYTTSKHAVIGMTRSAAFMYARDGIRVNAIAPGGVRTSIEARMRSALARERQAPILPALVQRPPADAGDIAATVLFLASDEARNINGAILPSDGGWTTL